MAAASARGGSPAKPAAAAEPHGELAEAMVAVGRAGEGVVETVCRVLSQIVLVCLIGVIALDIFTRSLLNYSFEISDEVGGYALVAIAFFSLAVCQAHDGFHRVEFILDRLSPRGRLVGRIVYDLVALGFALFLLWYLLRFTSMSFASGNAAPTRLMTPLWLPQLPMFLGMLAYVIALCRTLARSAASLRATADGKEPPGHGS